MREGPGRAGRALTIVFLLASVVAGFCDQADDLLAAGKKAFADGFYDVARGSFQRILIDHPQSTAAEEAGYLVGVSQYYAGHWSEAITALAGFQSRHAKSPLAPRASYWIGAAQLQLGKYENALRALGSAPGGPQALGAYAGHAALLRGVALEALHRDSEAAAAYRALLVPGASAVDASGTDASLAPEATFRLAGVEYRAGRFSQARELYGRILLDYPQSRFVRDSVFFLAECELAVGEPDAAEKRYVTLISLYPDSPWREAALYRLADAAYRKKDPGLALRRLDELHAQYPKGSYAASALRLRADILFDRRRYGDALASYRAAIDALPEGPEKQAAYYSAGLAELQLGRKSDAAQDFGKAAGAPGRAARGDLGEKASFQRAVLLAGLGRDEEAVAALSAYVDAYLASDRSEEALKLLASLLDARGEITKSSERWGALVTLHPDSPLLPEYLFNRGTALMKRGAPGALDDFQRILRDYPTSKLRDESEYSIGYIYARQGEHGRALPYFQAVARRAGGEIQARSRLSVGVCLFNMGRFDAALSSLEALAAAHPSDALGATASLYVGRTLYRMEKLSDAARRLSDAASALEAGSGSVDADTEAADARYWLGWSEFRLGNLAEARDAFLLLARSHPTDPRVREAFYRAGICETLLGDDVAAVSWFDQAVTAKAAPDGTETIEQALYEKGWALSRLGKTPQSREAFDELARSFPTGKLAAEAFFKLSMKAYDEARYTDAKSGFQDVATRFPRSNLASQALYWSAESARKATDFPGALEAYWAFFEKSPPAESLIGAGLEGFSAALDAASNIETAKQYAARAKAARGLDARISAGIQLHYAGMLLSADPSAALAAAMEVSRSSPPEPFAGEAGLLQGQSLAALGQTDKALAVFVSLSDSRMDEVGARATLERARALEAAGNGRGALEQYLRMPYVFPGFPDLAAEGLFNAARLSFTQGDKEGAIRIADILRKRYPGSPWAARADEIR